ncbi:MAG TPA: hypothetical protein VMD55_13450 [Terracidiphilus sp.]|nr:hypothetical protein [Terracidiphilus sp.]
MSRRNYTGRGMRKSGIEAPRSEEAASAQLAHRASQTNALRWEDFTTLAIDPADDCTFWYVGDYLKAGAENYTSRIAGLRLSDCSGRRRRFGPF